MPSSNTFPAGRLLVLLATSISTLPAQTAPAASADFFESKVRPVLANNCYNCHGNSQLGGLRLDSRDGMLKGGKSGPAIVPGKSGDSLLVRAIQQTGSTLKMPQGGKLKDDEIANIVAWVDAGASWPASAVTNTTKGDGKYVIAPERRNFWSLQPLRDPKIPAVKDARWPKTSIDRFVLARLEQQGLKQVKPASKHDLLRRATFDLTGLPPTPEEIAAFEKDTAPDAFAKVVDRLLASPHYGERWGRVWLDVARYGEDDYRSLNPNPRGFRPYPNAFVYRDWVIQAFNDDLPYDAFVKAQLAGDLLDQKTRYKTLPATGFLGLGPWYYDNGSVEVTRADERHDRVDVVTRGFLGLTVACARCHDHKYDPIPQTDYYSLAGVFLNTSYHEYPRVPKSVLDQYTKVEDEIEKKQKMLQTMQTNLGTQMAESLAFKIVRLPPGCLRCGRSQTRCGDGRRKPQTRLRTARPVDQVHGETHRQVQVQGSLAGHDEADPRRCGGGRWPRWTRRQWRRRHAAGSAVRNRTSSRACRGACNQSRAQARGPRN